ncbi:MAG: 3D domain-containing protein [Oscillospiraceae bacterium]|jgi:3D (Asp-Asp-Asp) domain-containing protein|nr:3D domain-containing protein [Oscillospiraceae bacterium]
MHHFVNAPVFVFLLVISLTGTWDFFADDSQTQTVQPTADVFSIQSDTETLQESGGDELPEQFYGVTPDYSPEDFPAAFAELAPSLHFKGAIPEPDAPAADIPEPQSAAAAAPADSSYLEAQTAALTGEAESFELIQAFEVRATAYTTERQENKITATGTIARVGAIAVDPKVIPYGTRLFIAAPDNSWVYGYATAEDCGGAVKNNSVDLFFDTYDECINFGVKTAVVYVLD